MPTYTQFSGTYIEVMDAAGMSYLYNSQTQEAFTIQMRADKTRDSIISYTHTYIHICMHVALQTGGFDIYVI